MIHVFSRRSCTRLDRNCWLQFSSSMSLGRWVVRIEVAGDRENMHALQVNGGFLG